MSESAWRTRPFAEALTDPALRERLGRALEAAGPLCDDCLGRLVANVGTGLRNAVRGRAAREALGHGPADGRCPLCEGLFERLDAWAARLRDAFAPWEFETFAVTSRADPATEAREQALWERVGGDLAEPYKQAFNREVGIRVSDLVGREPDLRQADLVALVDHGRDDVTVLPRPLYVAGRYRKLVRGIPQCRWPRWPTSVQQLVGDPICRAAEGTDHAFHGAGREDVDVRCLGERPFVLEVLRPRRRRLEWAALAAEIGAGGAVEVVDLRPCKSDEPARIKATRPEKTYRARVQLAAPVTDEDLLRLADLVGPIRQRTPRRVLRRRANRARLRRVRTLTWQRLDATTLDLTVRTSGGLYIKELVSSDDRRTRPSVAQVLGVEAKCVELDVLAIHWPEATHGA